LTITVGGSSTGGGGSTGGSSGTTWTLTVQGGTGSGTWPQYTWVNATANHPPPGQVFAGWTVVCSPCPALQFNDKANPALQIYGRSSGTATLVATYKVCFELLVCTLCWPGSVQAVTHAFMTQPCHSLNQTDCTVQRDMHMQVPLCMRPHWLLLDSVVVGLFCSHPHIQI
jgi:hypothetical protein